MEYRIDFQLWSWVLNGDKAQAGVGRVQALGVQIQVGRVLHKAFTPVQEGTLDLRCWRSSRSSPSIIFFPPPSFGFFPHGLGSRRTGIAGPGRLRSAGPARNVQDPAPGWRNQNAASEHLACFSPGLPLPAGGLRVVAPGHLAEKECWNPGLDTYSICNLGQACLSCMCLI